MGISITVKDETNTVLLFDSIQDFYSRLNSDNITTKVSDVRVDGGEMRIGYHTTFKHLAEYFKYI